MVRKCMAGLVLLSYGSLGNLTAILQKHGLCFWLLLPQDHEAKKCSCIFWQTQSFAKYCVKAGCPNTHILKTVCSVLSSHLFLVFGSNLAFDPKNKNQMHFSVNHNCWANRV